MVKSLTLALLPPAVAIGATALLAGCLGPWMGLLPRNMAAETRSLFVVALLFLPSALTVAAVEVWIWRRNAAARGG